MIPLIAAAAVRLSNSHNMLPKLLKNKNNNSMDAVRLSQSGSSISMSEKIPQLILAVQICLNAQACSSEKKKRKEEQYANIRLKFSSWIRRHFFVFVITADLAFFVYPQIFRIRHRYYQCIPTRLLYCVVLLA